MAWPYNLVGLYLEINSALLEDVGDDAEDADKEEECDEESLIKYYFQRGFTYQEIILFLAKRHNIEMSYSTLLRRMKLYGLSRRISSKKMSQKRFLKEQETASLR